MTFFSQLWQSVLSQIKSRKFRTLVVALLLALVGYLSNEVSAVQALQTSVLAIIAYIGSVGLEDGLSRRG